MPNQGTLLLTRADVTALLTIEDCIPAVESAFRDHALGRTSPSGVLGMHVEGGGFHIKAAGLYGTEAVFAVKVNGNFGANEARFGLPRIQGLLVLLDARHGYPLAVMDSVEITALRTAAATGVAAKYLARPGPATVTIAGCGRQSRSQLLAVAAVRPIARVFAHDVDGSRAEAFARDMGARLRRPVLVVNALAGCTRESGIIVTCTSATGVVLEHCDVAPGTFVAAVGADSDTKQELAPALLAASAVITDLTDQAATIGDLHHALAAGVMTRADVRAELGQVVAGLLPGRLTDEEIVIFDSTGTALQDVAAAALVYQRARLTGRGLMLDLLGGDPAAQRATGQPVLRTST